MHKKEHEHKDGKHHKLTHKEEVKGGHDSHMHHKKKTALPAKMASKHHKAK